MLLSFMDLILMKYLLNIYLLNTCYGPVTNCKAWIYPSTGYKSPEQNLGLHIISILVGEREIPIRVCMHVYVCVTQREECKNI